MHRKRPPRRYARWPAILLIGVLLVALLFAGCARPHRAPIAEPPLPELPPPPQLAK